MSLNSEAHGAAGAGAGALAGQAQGPRLRSGGYAAWKVEMDVFLERHGAAGVHHSALTEEDWLTRSSRVQQWGDEALAAALALELGPSGSSSNTTACIDSDHAERLHTCRE